MNTKTPKGQRRLKLVCRKGHPLANSRITPKGYFRCRVCEREGRNRYYAAHPERASVNALNDRRLRQLKRAKMLAFLGGKCVKCKFKDVRALQIDHVNGGGTKESKLFPYIGSRYKRIRQNPANYQLLCANCNAIKVFENEERNTKY